MGADGPPDTAPDSTPLHHAQDLGPIPSVRCVDAEILPITLDGVDVTKTPLWCDRPSAVPPSGADPLMQKIRYLDLLVDELARGKPMQRILRAPVDQDARRRAASRRPRTLLLREPGNGLGGVRRPSFP